MLKIINSPSNVVAIGLSGTVNKADVVAMEQELNAALAHHKHVGVVVDLTEFEDATPEAVHGNVRYELGMINMIDRFPRVAVLCNKQWVSMAAHIAGGLLSSVEFKVFPSTDADDAMAFAANAGQQPLAHQSPAITTIETGSQTVLAYEISGRLTTEDIDLVATPMMATFDKYDSIDLLIRLKDYSSFDSELLLQRSVISMKLAALTHVRRYAIVGAKPWMDKLVSLFKPLAAMNIRTFDLREETDAWEWLTA